METVYVTTSLHASKSICEQGRKWAVAIHAFFIERGEQNIEQLLTAYHIEAILVFTVQGPEIRTFLGRHAFHVSMAELRIQHIRQGMPDHFLEALGAEGPVRLLDCTCGFGSDTIVASFGLPAGSDVHALEISPEVAYVYNVYDVSQMPDPGIPCRVCTLLRMSMYPTHVRMYHTLQSMYPYPVEYVPCCV